MQFECNFRNASHKIPIVAIVANSRTPVRAPVWWWSPLGSLPCPQHSDGAAAASGAWLAAPAEQHRRRLIQNPELLRFRHLKKRWWQIKGRRDSGSRPFTLINVTLANASFLFVFYLAALPYPLFSLWAIEISEKLRGNGRNAPYSQFVGTCSFRVLKFSNNNFNLMRHVTLIWICIIIWNKTVLI